METRFKVLCASARVDLSVAVMAYGAWCMCKIICIKLCASVAVLVGVSDTVSG